MKTSQLLARAKSHEKRGEISEAIQFYLSVLEASPQNSKAIKRLKALRATILQNSQSSPTQDEIDSVIALHSNGQIRESLQTSELLINKYPHEAFFYNLSGVCYADLSQLETAVRYYHQALNINPDYAEVHSNLGNVLQDIGQLDEAVSSFQRALEIQPDYLEAHYNLGILLQNIGQLDAAVNSYEQALKINPDYTKAHFNLGMALKTLGQLDAAVNSYEKVLKITPNHAEAHYNLGNVFRDLGQLNEAVTRYQRALEINSDYADAYHNLGNTLKELGQLDEAVSSYKQALEVNPDYADAHNNLGNTFKELGQLENAAKCYQRALEITPDYANAYNNLGNTLKDLGQLEAATKCYQLQLEITPDNAGAHNNLGNIFFNQNLIGKAISCFERSLEIHPDHINVLSNLGAANEKLGKIDVALNYYERALTINSEFIEGRFNLSLLQLGNGLINEGFKNYEIRWKYKDFTSPSRRFSIPRWRGESLQGKNILLWAEQGIGDEIHFASLIPEFKDLGCNVGIECAAKLVELFQWSFPWAEVRETGAVNCEGSEAYGLFDYQIPFGSIAPLLRTTLDDFRIYQKPYIPRLKEGEIKVRNKLNLKQAQLLIGLSWRSSNQSEKRSVHYLTVEDLAPLKTIKNAVFLGLQYDDCIPELDRVRELGLPVRYYTNIDQKNDLSSTCALIGACDLVISAGTAVAQMSGALGVPTIQFHSHKGRKKPIPWFPTLRHFSLNPDAPSLLINNIINQMPELITWANEVTSSKRPIDS